MISGAGIVRTPGQCSAATKNSLQAVSTTFRRPAARATANAPAPTAATAPPVHGSAARNAAASNPLTARSPIASLAVSRVVSNEDRHFALTGAD